MLSPKRDLTCCLSASAKDCHFIVIMIDAHFIPTQCMWGYGERRSMQRISFQSKHAKTWESMHGCPSATVKNGWYTKHANLLPSHLLLRSSCASGLLAFCLWEPEETCKDTLGQRNRREWGPDKTRLLGFYSEAAVLPVSLLFASLSYTATAYPAPWNLIRGIQHWGLVGSNPKWELGRIPRNRALPAIFPQFRYNRHQMKDKIMSRTVLRVGNGSIHFCERWNQK